MKISTIISLLIDANASHETLLKAVVAWEDDHDDELAEAEAEAERRREQVRLRVQRWREKRDVTLHSVTERYVTLRNGSRAPAPAEGSSSKKEITEQKKEESKIRSPSGSRLPKDFVPEPGIASGLGLTRREFEDQFAQFKDYWTAKAGKDARKADWQATWRNWCRRALKFRKPEREKNYAEQFSDMMENGHEKADDDGRADEAGDWGNDRRIGSGEGSQFERYDFPLLGDGKNGKH